MVHETRRLLEAATALHALLAAAGIPHAFHGDFVVAVLANAPHCNVSGRNLDCHRYLNAVIRKYFAL